MKLHQKLFVWGKKNLKSWWRDDIKYISLIWCIVITIQGSPYCRSCCNNLSRKPKKIISDISYDRYFDPSSFKKYCTKFQNREIFPWYMELKLVLNKCVYSAKRRVRIEGGDVHFLLECILQHFQYNLFS